MKKVSIIGTGNVGIHAAESIFRSCAAEIVLMDIREGWSEGISLDISQSANLTQNYALIKGADGYGDIKDSDFIIITAGSPRKAGMSRMDLLEINRNIMNDIGNEILSAAPNAVVLIITNPVDHLTHFFKKDFPSLNVFGFGCALDSVRYRYFIGRKLNINPSHINGLIIGTHNPDMIPYIEGTSVGGVPVTEFLNDDELRDIRELTVNAGTEIVKYLKTTGSSYTAGEILGRLAKAVLEDRPDVFSVDTLLTGEMGISGVTLSVPAVVNGGGVSKVLPLPASGKTFEQFNALARKTGESQNP